MKQALFLAAILVTSCYSHVNGQSQDPPKYEVAAEFAVMGRPDFYGTRTEAGPGVRFTFNLNRNVALESAVYLFPRRCFECRSAGRMTEAVGGVKVGKRFETWGIFAKARPGIGNFSDGQQEFVVVNQPPNPPVVRFETSSVTHFAADLGAVVEFYPSERIVARFDAGDTIIHFRRHQSNGLVFSPIFPGFFLFPSFTPARTTHNFQFVSSVGFRF